MPYFRYAANDSNGRAMQGTVQANSPDEAAAALSQKGIRVTAWLDAAAKNAIPAAYQPTPQRLNAPPPSTSNIQHPTPNVSKRQIVLETPSAMKINALQTTGKCLEPKRTRRGKDKERFFLFTQIASLLNAGVNPHKAFADMASRMRRDDYREAMMKVAQYAGEGMPISEVLAAYPDLFPSHVVGIVRAGEVGGFLPEACTAVAQQAEASHKFRRSLWFVWAVAINFLLVPPFAYLFYRALPRGYELIESSGVSDPGGGIQQMAKAFSQLFWWPIAPTAALIYGITYGIYTWLNSRPMTLRRHGLSLSAPVLGGRAKNEGLSLFAWIISKVAQAGTPPYRSWEIGMDAVPNLALKEKLRSAAARLHSGERLSTAFYEAKLFPEEYAPMVATGEMTGDVPGMLQRLSEMSRQEFEVSTTKSKAAAWVMSSVTIAVTMGIIALAIILTLYYALPNTVLKGMDTP